MKLRLDKFLADMSVGTRSEVKQYIRKGRICVNRIPQKDGGMKIDTETDEVTMDGEPVSYVEYEYLMLHKPAGVITAVSDFREKTVLDLIETTRKDLFPAGRLDKDTEGLLLLTNHGILAHNMLSPKKHVDKTYYAEINDVLSEEMCRQIQDGVYIENDYKTRPAKLEILSNEPEQVKVLLTISEGKFHQVKKMFEAVDRRVCYLKRVSFGPLKLDEHLKPGEYRPLTESEIASLKEYMSES